MRQSQLFTKSRKEAPKDEVAKNAELLIRAGFINKEMAGAYSYLPLGLRTLNKIVGIIREEMNGLGAQELFLTALQEKTVWEKTDRWSDDKVDNWFKTKLKSGTELGLGFTHEEPLTALMKNHISSFRDLPLSAYQFQTKFRNEARAKSGILRGREFLMKDLYSFSKDEKEHNEFYERVKGAYSRIFQKVGLGDQTYVTFASGGSFSKYSHEFQTLTSAGEDNIYVCNSCRIAVNEEIIKDQPTCPNCKSDKLEVKKAVEVGNIFSLGDRFSKALDLVYLDQAGVKKPVIMGSYGIGPGRVMGTIVEINSDENGIIWPKAVAPFQIHLISVDGGKPEIKEKAEKIYEALLKSGTEVLFDDRELRAGEKFAEADLLGLPLRVVVSDKSLKAGGVEVKERKGGAVRIVAEEHILSQV
ncbi:MAG: aminoacyl--tRNA ligase-related protein [Candidatus Paceibacterota bacterium]